MGGRDDASIPQPGQGGAASIQLASGSTAAAFAVLLNKVINDLNQKAGIGGMLKK